MGQGDCSVVHLPNEQLFIVDVGPTNSMLPQWLDARPDLRIHSLILTHNDEDHAGCAMDILQRMHHKIGRFVFVDDRRADTTTATDELLAFGARLHQKGKISMVRLEAREEPQPLYGFDGGADFKAIIYALYPDAAAATANLHARSSSKPNEVSGILCLDVNGRTEVIWAGDAPMQTLSKVATDKSPLIVVGPHHGGPIKRDQKSYAPSFDQPNPENVFISAGTTNKHDHPIKKFIDLHRERSRRVCCSQLVHCDRQRIQAKDHVLNSHISLGMLPPKSSSAVTCRGPIQLTWNQQESRF